jgi:hypothetical protein
MGGRGTGGNGATWGHEPAAASGLLVASLHFRRHRFDPRLQGPLVRDAAHHRSREAQCLIEVDGGSVASYESPDRITERVEQQIARRAHAER